MRASAGRAGATLPLVSVADYAHPDASRVYDCLAIHSNSRERSGEEKAMSPDEVAERRRAASRPLPKLMANFTWHVAHSQPRVPSTAGSDE